MEILRVEKLCKVYGTGEARVDALKLNVCPFLWKRGNSPR